MNYEKLKTCRTKQEYLSFISDNCENNKFTAAFRRKIMNSHKPEEWQQLTWDCCLQNEGKYFLGKEVTKKSWFKGTAIRGMECHSH